MSKKSIAAEKIIEALWKSIRKYNMPFGDYERLEEKIAVDGLNAALFLAPHALLSQDTNGVINYCSHKAGEVFGYSFAELMGQKSRILVPKEHLQNRARLLDEVLEGEGRMIEEDTIRLHKTEGQIPVHV